jgi:hypothetical protein
MRTLAKLTIILLFLTTGLRGQAPEIEKLLADGELKMTFPSIYFKHNSTDYAVMPYTADSCFKYIATNIEYLNSYPLWRDSSETEELTDERMLKLKADLKKFTSTRRIRFESMGDQQKVARSTINKSTDAEQRAYLLSLNSVLDVSGVMLRREKSKKKSHVDRPRLWCINCWENHRFSKSYRLHLKQKKKQAAVKS